MMMLIIFAYDLRHRQGRSLSLLDDRKAASGRPLPGKRAALGAFALGLLTVIVLSVLVPLGRWSRPAASLSRDDAALRLGGQLASSAEESHRSPPLLVLGAAAASSGVLTPGNPAALRPGHHAEQGASTAQPRTAAAVDASAGAMAEDDAREPGGDQQRQAAEASAWPPLSMVTTVLPNAAASEQYYQSLCGTRLAASGRGDVTMANSNSTVPTWGADLVVGATPTLLPPSCIRDRFLLCTY